MPFDSELPTNKVLSRKSVSILSPLRYPGSKRRLASYIMQTLQLNHLQPRLFVEPFAGGASVALQLLQEGLVEGIGLIERDPLVAAFWKVVFSKDAQWLIDQVATIPVTLEQWKIYKKTIPTDLKERALACLFLNRTSFSGIMTPKVGPIGGKSQLSAYPIDCRFPRQTLIKRILQAQSLRDRVLFVWNIHWKKGLQLITSMQSRESLPRDIFYYLDPPFINKADQLYTYWFRRQDHQDLCNYTSQMKDKWLLSYDVDSYVLELYEHHHQSCVELLYSTSSGAGSKSVREIIITNLPYLPSATRLWQTSHERKIAREIIRTKNHH
ncbi:MAG: DNA adenine methylase [Synechococcaceae cyanobacterium SM2_3_2]|nr:DNA adenine methylase [Synechococcaceae cyanobacterium SM2_3_2]